ncbi:MAG: Sec-independent protein translocase protein TatB [Syntrophomonadaceae bacterium]|nr:Sec-independent protein translocase protein TatB [Syntrophomonadaceae bacterium]
MFGFFSNIGPWELAIVALVALIVVGPDKLPEMMRTFARTLNNLRDIGDGYKREFQEALNVDEINELKNSVQDMQKDMQNMMNPLTPPAKNKAPGATQVPVVKPEEEEQESAAPPSEPEPENVIGPDPATEAVQ